MKNKWLYGLIMITPVILIVIVSIFSLHNKLFMGLEPKVVFNGYRIYDVVEQKNLACAEAIEFLASDEKYDYYFPCLKSSKIYFVNNRETINVREAYNRGIITLEKLYELDIVDRMVKQDVK